MKKVFIVTQYELPDWKRNLNAYQRVFYGAKYADIHLLIRKRHTVSQELAKRVNVHRAPFDNRLLFLLYAILFANYLRLKGCRIILTEPSGFALVGFFAKLLAGYFWVMDIWDTPRRRSGPTRFSDRLAFFIMSFADLYLLSILPEGARGLRLNPNKCLQLFNAIDLGDMAQHPPLRPADDSTLHLAFIRSEFHDEANGLCVLIKAAAKLKQLSCPIVVHLVGEISEKDQRTIELSDGAAFFRIYGFIPGISVEFFRKIHVGLVPFLTRVDFSHTFPIKVIDHLSQGNPVIASRLPGICTMITHEFNGLLCEPGNSDQLAAAIQRLQMDRQLWEILARNSLKSAEKYEATGKNCKIFAEIFARENRDRP